jgi:hypothetical protein
MTIEKLANGNVIVAQGHEFMSIPGDATLKIRDAVSILIIWDNGRKIIRQPEITAPVSEDVHELFSILSSDFFFQVAEEDGFNDYVFTLTGERLNSAAGSVQYDWNEGAVVFKPNGEIGNTADVVVCDGQYPHSGDLTGKIYPHLHWWQPDNRNYVFTMRYRIHPNGQPKTGTWTEVTAQANTPDSVFQYVSGTLNQITFFGSGQGSQAAGIQLPANALSCIVQFRFTRTDTLSGDILGQSFDFHYLVDSRGSKTQGQK